MTIIVVHLGGHAALPPVAYQRTWNLISPWSRIPLSAIITPLGGTPISYLFIKKIGFQYRVTNMTGTRVVVFPVVFMLSIPHYRGGDRASLHEFIHRRWRFHPAAPAPDDEAPR